MPQINFIIRRPEEVTSAPPPVEPLPSTTVDDQSILNTGTLPWRQVNYFTTPITPSPEATVPPDPSPQAIAEEVVAAVATPSSAPSVNSNTVDDKNRFNLRFFFINLIEFLTTHLPIDIADKFPYPLDIQNPTHKYNFNLKKLFTYTKPDGQKYLQIIIETPIN